MIIHQLDKKVYNRISAGEVVERPFSVVKELVENSIDAGSTKVTITIKGGGRELIEVTDNGSGFYRDDLKTAILPHATSKILNTEDLDNIVTLGFRGEALASIAAISNLEIISKRADCECGYSMKCNGGECQDIIDVPSITGTTIRVYNLFYNTPARLKFLKSDKLEEGEITNYVSRLILSNPDVAITYKDEDGIVLQSFGDGREGAIISVYGKEALSNSFKVENYKNGVKIEGYIGNHNYTKANRTYQTTILNGRYIINNTIQSSIFNAYGPYLMKRRYPFYVLYIKLPSELVDVNVTPNKSDVRFVDNSVIYSALYSTVSKVLDGTDSALNIVVEDKPKKQDVVVDFVQNDQAINIPFEDVKTNDNIDDIFSRSTFDLSNIENKKPEKVDFVSSIFDEVKEEKPSSIDIFEENKKYIEKLEQEKKDKQKQSVNNEFDSKLVYKCQVLDSYLVMEKGEDLYFVDQHAGHERVLYDKLCKIRESQEKVLQPLFIPYVIKVNALEYGLIEKRIKYLNDFGIEIKENTRGEFEVVTVPVELLNMNMKDFFDDIIQDNSLREESIPQIINEGLMQKACKAAIKAGMKMNDSEVKCLISSLSQNISLKCPHGRPIAIKIERKEIDKWFKRIV